MQRVLASLTAFCIGWPVRAQCLPDWAPVGPGLDATVFASTTWDPDGPGPLPAVLVAGGGFHFGGTETHGVAIWNGAIWSPLGSIPGVIALGQYQGTLVAGGLFGGGVMQWNGLAWVPFGSGLNSVARALAVYSGAPVIHRTLERRELGASGLRHQLPD